MIDLHLHSTCSDGTESPEALAALLAAGGAYAAALTDHDGTDGCDRFLAEAERLGIRAIRGMELSADVPGRTVHLVAYGFDPTEPTLRDLVEKIRTGRAERNERILGKLLEIGIRITPDEVRAKTPDGRTIGRPHIAAVLIEKGYARDRAAAFKRFLGRGGLAYVERFRATPETCIACVRAAGGVVSLAHPSQIGFNKTELHDFVRRLAEAGLSGIEAYYPGHLPNMLREYLDLANEFSLVPTGGTDFHGANKPGLSPLVGYGTLRVPDASFDALLERIPR